MTIPAIAPPLKVGVKVGDGVGVLVGNAVGTEAIIVSEVTVSRSVTPAAVAVACKVVVNEPESTEVVSVVPTALEASAEVVNPAN